MNEPWSPPPFEMRVEKLGPHGFICTHCLEHYPEPPEPDLAFWRCAKCDGPVGPYAAWLHVAERAVEEKALAEEKRRAALLPRGRAS